MSRAESIRVDLDNHGQLCPMPTCGRPTGWPAPGLCSECLDRVCRLREQPEQEQEETCE